MKINTQRLRDFAASRGFTVTSLARATGLTRQALHAILRENSAEVRKTTGQRLARALMLPDENALGEDPLAGYKARLAEEHAQLDFHGLGMAATEPRCLNELYVPVRVRLAGKSKHDKNCRMDSFQPGMESIEPSLSEDDLGNLVFADCLLRHRQVLLRGDPGGGKTTSLRHVARSYARGTQARDGYPDRPLVPLFVRLADYAKAREQDSGLTLVQFVVAPFRSSVSPESAGVVGSRLEEELKRGQGLVLLDGLDEVGRGGNLVAALRDFIRGYSDNYFVLTSRVVGLDVGPWEQSGFMTCEITPWREEDIREFARRWYASRNGGGERRQRENERRAEKLSAAILNSSSLREIATNPLMLTILAALHHADAALPRRRVDVYAKVVAVLLETWEAAKRNALPGDPLHGIILESREFEWLLSRPAR